VAEDHHLAALLFDIDFMNIVKIKLPQFQKILEQESHTFWCDTSFSDYFSDLACFTLVIWSISL